MALALVAPGWAARNEQYERVYFDPNRLPSERNAVAFESDSESDYDPSDEDGHSDSRVAPQRPQRRSDGGDDDSEMVAAESDEGSERIPVFGLVSRGAAAAFEHAAGLQGPRHMLAAPVSDRTLPRSQNGSGASEMLVGIFERGAVEARPRDNDNSCVQLAAASRCGPCAAAQPVLLASGGANEVDPTCNICYSAYVSRQLPCGHRLCESCVSSWRTAGHDTCPFCRAQIDSARVKEVGVLEYPGRVPMDPVGEAFMRFVARKVAVPSDRPRCKPRGGRTITIKEKDGVVIEPDWDNLAGIFPDRAIPFAPRKRTTPRPLFRSGDADLAAAPKIAEDTESKSETGAPGGSDGIGPTYDCATVSEEIRGEDGRPAADRDREACERSSITARSSRRTKPTRPRMRRSSGTSDLSCEHADRCSPEAAADDLSAPSANGDDVNAATEQDGAGNPEPPGDVSVARAYDALVGQRWDQLLQVINPPQVTARRGVTEPELPPLYISILGPDDV